MKTRAFFENIQKEIIRELINSKNSIKIAVAWFTDKEIFDALSHKVELGVEVEIILIDDEINRSSGINYDLLKKKKGNVLFVNYSKELPLMHNKFCIIDNNIVINGSYNWTKKARKNHESITIIKDNIELVEDFTIEFENIKSKYFGEPTDRYMLDNRKTCLRLDALKNAIKLEDQEDIIYQVSKIKKIIALFKEENEIQIIHRIVNQIENYNYSESVSLINNYLSKYRSLIRYIDEELVALKLEVKALEIQISSIEDEIVEIEKIIHDFEIAYNNELGQLFLKILKLKRDKYKKNAKNNPLNQKLYEDAEKDFQGFYEMHSKTKLEKYKELSSEEIKEIKDKFRQASKYCHPDIVSSQFKEEAEKIFISLKNAYENNDLNTVTKILSNLKKGKFVNISSEINEKDKLNFAIISLRNKRDQLEGSLFNLKQTQTFKTIIEISDWSEYFRIIKKNLLNELNYLKENE